MTGILFNYKNLITVLIIVAVVILMIVLMKYQHLKPILVLVLALGWAGFGAYSGFTWYKYEMTHSQVVGTPTIHDPYENFNYFEYDLKKLAWYESEDGTYSYTEKYNTSLKFDGSENKYILLLNNTPCNKTTSSKGKLHGELTRVFEDLDGNEINQLTFKIDFEFYSSEINIIIKVDADSETIGLAKEMVEVEGFKLRIIDSIYST